MTNPDNAVACAEAGVDIIGLVFSDKSPRHLSHGRALMITRALAPPGIRLGVFVDATIDTILSTVAACGLKGVQLHRNEQPDLVNALAGHPLTVIKALFADRTPSLDIAETYEGADFFLVECGTGPLPGGNAKTWDYGRAGNLARRYPIILAGGLSPENIRQAMAQPRPDAKSPGH